MMHYTIVNEMKVMGVTENILLIFPLNRPMRVQNTGNALIFKQSTYITSFTCRQMQWNRMFHKKLLGHEYTHPECI